MKWRPKNFVESLVPLYTVFAILGHRPFHYPPGRRHPRFTFIYVITLMPLYYVLIIFNLKYFRDRSWFNAIFEKAIFTEYVNVSVATLGQILSWYYMNTLTNIIKRTEKIDETLQELGATFDYTKCMNLQVGMISLWIITSSMLNGVEISWLVNKGTLGEVTIIVTIFFLPFHLNSMMAYNFSTVVSIIGMRFRKANEVLEKIVKPIRPPVNHPGLSYLKGKMSVIPFTMSTRPTFRGIAYKQCPIYTIKHVHLELSAISRAVARVYGVQVTLEIAACFTSVTFFLYEIYRIATIPLLPRRYHALIMLAMWCTSYFVKVLAINKVCEDISTEAYRTGDILHRIEKPIGDREFSDEIQQFSLQIIQNRLFFSPAGFITLGWNFFREFIGTVTTYLIIFIQDSSLLGE